MYLEVGEHKFIRSYISWHLLRKGFYAPWEIIGVVSVREDVCSAFYEKKYNHFEKKFIKEWSSIKSNTVRASKEALEHYRKKFKSPFCLMTPVITYYTLYVSEWSKRSIYRLSLNYLGHSKSAYLALIGIMIRMKDGYFPFLFRYYGKNEQKKELVDLLIKKGYLKCNILGTVFTYNHPQYKKLVVIKNGKKTIQRALQKTK